MPKRKPKPETKSELIAALKHIVLCQREIGTEDQTHCYFENGFITACDATLAAGVFAQEEIMRRPHTHSLLRALERCEETISLTATAHNLAIKSGPFRALIPCVEQSGLLPMPDPIAGTVSPALLYALEAAGIPTRPLAPVLSHGSILLRSGSALGTNGNVLVEAWHGIAFPQEYVLPKCFEQALTALAKTPTHFGYSDRTFTVYFDDKSWLRTQLYAESWPDAPKTLLDVASNPQAIHEDFFKAARIVGEFSKEDDVFAEGAYLSSRPLLEGSEGAAYELKGATLPKLHMDAKMLAIVEPFCEKVDFTALGRKGLLFFGDNVRGAVGYRA